MAGGGWSYGFAGAVLAVGAVLLLYHHEMSTIDPWYLLFIVAGTAGVSFTVGWVLGYLTDSGIATGPGERE